MAQPRIFVSSTFYDLKYIRNDLEKFIQSLGYEAILNERGAIPYGKSEPLENYAYREIETSDILVSIVGGRYGAQSESSTHSISQREVKKAIELNKPVYIFIQKDVFGEYQTYLANKDKDINFRSVDNKNIFKFIEELSSLPNNNVMHEFDSVDDITFFLKAQWAGLFQRMLQEQTRVNEIELIQNLRSSAETLDKLVSYLTQKNEEQSHTLRDILMFNHPAHQRINTILGAPYRTFFVNQEEMESFIKARRFTKVKEPALDDADWLEYLEKTDKIEKMWIHVWKGIFDDNGKLKVYTKEEWNDDWIQERTYNEPGETDPDEVPF